mgnify:CR=1 FL=1
MITQLRRLVHSPTTAKVIAGSMAGFLVVGLSAAGANTALVMSPLKVRSQTSRALTTNNSTSQQYNFFGMWVSRL